MAGLGATARPPGIANLASSRGGLTSIVWMTNRWRSGLPLGPTSIRVFRLLEPPAGRWAAVPGVFVGVLALVAVVAAAVLQPVSLVALVRHVT